MAPGQEGAKPSGKGLVNHPVFAFNGDYSLRRQRGCEVKRETLSRGPHSLAPAGASEVPSKFPICWASLYSFYVNLTSVPQPDTSTFAAIFRASCETAAWGRRASGNHRRAFLELFRAVSAA